MQMYSQADAGTQRCRTSVSTLTQGFTSFRISDAAGGGNTLREYGLYGTQTQHVQPHAITAGQAQSPRDMLVDVSLSESGVCVYEPLGITATSSRETGATQGRRGAHNPMQSQSGSKQTLTHDASQAHIGYPQTPIRARIEMYDDHIVSQGVPVVQSDGGEKGVREVEEKFGSTCASSVDKGIRFLMGDFLCTSCGVSLWELPICEEKPLHREVGMHDTYFACNSCVKIFLGPRYRRFPDTDSYWASESVRGYHDAVNAGIIRKLQHNRKETRSRQGQAGVQPGREATQPPLEPTCGGTPWGRLSLLRWRKTHDQQECRRATSEQASKKLNFDSAARESGSSRFDFDSSDEDSLHGDTPDSSSACYEMNAMHAVIGPTPRWDDSDEEESKECVDLRDINSDDWQGYTDADVEAMRMLDEESYDDYQQGGVLCYDTDDDGHVRDAWVQEYRGESDDEHESQQSDNESHNGDNDAADAEHDQAGRDVDESD